MKEIVYTIAKSDGPMKSTYVTEGGTCAYLFCHPLLAESVLDRIDDKDYSIHPIDDELAWMISLQSNGVQIVQQYSGNEVNSGVSIPQTLDLQHYIPMQIGLKKMHEDND
jgi:hypothetical protein